MKPIIIQYTAKNFIECLEIINKVGQIAESQNHHPDIKLHGYKHLEFTLFTHDDSTVTSKDTQLAAAIKTILSDFS